MHKEYLGEGYHEKLRKMLTLPEDVLPNSVIDADINIEAMKAMLAPALDRMMVTGKQINTEAKFNQLSQAAMYYLAGVLCIAMKSRTSDPAYKKYRRRWDKKRENYMRKGSMLAVGLQS